MGLTLLLAGLSSWRLKRYGHYLGSLLLVVLAGIVLAVTLDGQVTDWAGKNPIATDPQGDSTDPKTDLTAAFADVTNGVLGFRMDVVNAEGNLPAITSANAVAFTVGSTGSFTVTTSGAPTPTLARGGVALPNGATFVDNGDGTGTLSGTPAAGTGGSYALTFTATNANGTSPVQNFTLNINQAPAITSANAITFPLGVATTFTVTTTGFPRPALARGGAALPAGVTFTDNGDGTGTLSGTPAAGTGGSYALTFTATNSVGSSPVQNFALTVNQAPTITSSSPALFTLNTNGTHTIATTGTPTVTSITLTGCTLPAGLAFSYTSGANATITGTPTAAGSVTCTVTASNGVAPNATQSLDVTVLLPPPVAVNDGAYPATGGVSINVPAVGGVLVNDTLNFANLVSFGPTTGAERLAGTSGASAQGGSVTVNADGSFTYDPPANALLGGGSDTFKYTLTNSSGSSVGTVTIAVSNRIFFVNNAGTAGDGRLSSPFNSLAAVPAGRVNGSVIFVYQGSGPYASTLTMKTNEALIGQGVALGTALTDLGITLAPNSATLPGVASKPILGGTVTLASGTTVRALDLSTGASTGISGSGGLTSVTIPSGATATDNVTVTTTTGTAVLLNGVDQSNLTFKSISANGAANGISLTNVNTTFGSFTVTGDGATPGSGGTIRNTVGADGATAGNGIYLSNANNVSLSWMQLNDHPNFAIRGLTVNGFTMDHSGVSGTNGNNAASPFNEGSISFSELTGSATISNSNISGGFADNFRVVNTSGTLNRITFTNATVGANSTSDGNDGITLEAQNGTVINATIQNSFFTSARGDLFQFNNIGTAACDLVFTGNTLSNNHPAIATGGGGVTIGGGDNGGSLTYNISGNSFRDADGHAILIVKSTGSGSYTGTFDSNPIGVAGVSDSGSRAGSGLKLKNAGLGTVTTAITNNSIHQYNNFGIELETGGGATALAGALNTTITGNTVANPGTSGLPMNGIHLNAGTVPGDTYQVCTKIGSGGANNITGSGANIGTDFRLRQRQATTVRLPGYGGANNDNTAVVTFVQGNNGGTPTGLASNTVPTGGGFIGTGTTCP